MTMLLRIAGAAACLIGLVWIGQGLGYIGGSFMTGSLDWFRNGVIVLLIGLALIASGFFKRTNQ